MFGLFIVLNFKDIYLLCSQGYQKSTPIIHNFSYGKCYGSLNQLIILNDYGSKVGKLGLYYCYDFIGVIVLILIGIFNTLIGKEH